MRSTSASSSSRAERGGARLQGGSQIRADDHERRGSELTGIRVRARLLHRVPEALAEPGRAARRRLALRIDRLAVPGPRGDGDAQASRIAARPPRGTGARAAAPSRDRPRRARRWRRAAPRCPARCGSPRGPPRRRPSPRPASGPIGLRARVGLSPKRPQHGGGDADRAAAVGGVRHRHHAAPRPRPPSRRSSRPRCARDSTDCGSGPNRRGSVDAGQAQLRRVGLAEDHQPGALAAARLISLS